MLSFLHKTFDKGNFVGEIIASIFIILLFKIINHHFRSKKYTSLTLMGIVLTSCIMMGQGIGHLTSGADTVFGVLPSAILTSFFFNQYNLLGSIIGAQIIGSLVGWLLYWPYKYLFKNIKDKQNKPTTLTWTQFTYKEIIGQIMMVLMIMFMTFAHYGKGSKTDAYPIIVSLILVAGIIGILTIFAQVNFFMFSPIISLFMIDHKLNSHEIWKLTIQTSIFIAAILIVGFSTYAVLLEREDIKPW